MCNSCFPPIIQAFENDEKSDTTSAKTSLDVTEHYIMDDWGDYTDCSKTPDQKNENINIDASVLPPLFFRLTKTDVTAID